MAAHNTYLLFGRKEWMQPEDLNGCEQHSSNVSGVYYCCARHCGAVLHYGFIRETPPVLRLLPAACHGV